MEPGEFHLGDIKTFLLLMTQVGGICILLCGMVWRGHDDEAFILVTIMFLRKFYAAEEFNCNYFILTLCSAAQVDSIRESFFFLMKGDEFIFESRFIGPFYNPCPFWWGAKPHGSVSPPQS